MRNITTDFDWTTNRDFSTMYFVSMMDVFMGTPRKHNWWTMGRAEKSRWRAFQERFIWPDDDPDEME